MVMNLIYHELITRGIVNENSSDVDTFTLLHVYTFTRLDVDTFTVTRSYLFDTSTH